MKKKSAVTIGRPKTKRRRYTPQKLKPEAEPIPVHEQSKVGEQDKDAVTENLERMKNISQKPDQTFTCEICSKHFQKKHLFTRHKHSHQDPASLVCDICYKTYGSVVLVQKHVAKAHTGSSYVCICSWTDSDIGHLREHKTACDQHARMMAERKRYRCDVCNLAYTRAHSLRKHNAQKHPNRLMDSCIPAENYGDSRKVETGYVASPVDHGEIESATTDMVAEKPGPHTTCTETNAGKEEPKAAVNKVRWEWADQPELVGAGGLLGDVTKACHELERGGRDVFVMVRDQGQLLYLESAQLSGFLRNNPSLVQNFLNHGQNAEKSCKDDLNVGVNVVLIKYKAGAGQLHANNGNPPTLGTHNALEKEVDTVPTSNDWNIDKQHEESSVEPYMFDNTIEISADNDNNLNELDDMSMESLDDSLSEEKHITLRVVANEKSNYSMNETETLNIPVQLDKSVIDESRTVSNIDLNTLNGSTSRETVIDTAKLSGQEKTNMRERMRLYQLWHTKYYKMEGINDSTEIDDDTVNSRPELDKDNQVTFPCAKCGSHFLIERHLKSHQIRHTACDKGQNKKELSNRSFLAENITYVEENGTEVTRTFQSVFDSQTSAPYQCLICRSVYPTVWKLFNHISTHCEKSLFSCIICARRYRSDNALQVHIKKHYQRPYDCYQCRMFFVNEEGLRQHQLNKCLHSRLLPSHSDVTILSCEQCSFTTPNRSMLLAHQQKHEKPADQHLLKCQICDHQVTTMSGLARHLMSVHQQERPYTCDACGKSFKLVDCYRRHLKTHREKIYKCEECDKSFSEKDYLRKHALRHSGEKPFVCDICGEAFARSAYLKNHRRKHTGETPYICKEKACGKGFRCQQNLTQHMRTHEKVGMFTCDICGRTFKQPGQLNHHRKNHIIEWRWPCTYCEEKFKSCWRYKRHLAMSHPEKKEEIEKTTNIRLHKCTMCEKMFHDKEDMKRHMNGHLGIKPFHCKYCDKLFSDKSNLRVHEQRHAGVKKLKCSSCYKSFVHEKNLTAHMEKHKDEVRCEYQSVMDSVKADDISSIVTGGQVDMDLYGKLVVDQLSQFPL